MCTDTQKSRFKLYRWVHFFFSFGKRREGLQNQLGFLQSVFYWFWLHLWLSVTEMQQNMNMKYPQSKWTKRRQNLPTDDTDSIKALTEARDPFPLQPPSLKSFAFTYTWNLKKNTNWQIKFWISFVAVKQYKQFWHIGIWKPPKT